MKKLTTNLLLVLSILLLTSCGGEDKLPEGFEVTLNKGNIYFVYLHENLRGKKSDQRRACTKLCKLGGNKECEVYMWSKRDLIPDDFPIRKAASFIHSKFQIDSKGKKKYKCLECT
jgi:hypothetical protein